MSHPIAEEKESHRMSSDDRPVCFIISPIGVEGSDMRIRSDKVSRHLIEKAADACGYRAFRADKIADPGMITSQVIQQIIDAPMVVADLSFHNANVFYELAIRHALRKPYVQIIDKVFPIPFDLSVTRTVMFDLQDPDVLETSRAELITQIRAVEGKQDVDSPISNAIDVEHMRRKGNPEQRQLAELMSNLGELKQSIRAINEALSHRGYLPTVIRVPSIEPTGIGKLSVDANGVVTMPYDSTPVLFPTPIELKASEFVPHPITMQPTTEAQPKKKSTS